jgi:pyruvate dehydrogenase E1 component alpha subunit
MHVLDEAAFAGLEAEVQQDLARAVAFAEAGTWEPVEQLTRDVYTPRQEVARDRRAS